MARSKYVKVTGSIPAKTEPAFLIRVGRKLFVTAAVIEYDGERVRSDAEKEGVALMWRLFEQARNDARSNNLETIDCFVADESTWVAVGTGPPGVGTSPRAVGTNQIEGDSDGDTDPEE